MSEKLEFRSTRPLKIWQDVSAQDWSSWPWQLRNRIDSIEKLEAALKLENVKGLDIFALAEDIRRTQTDFNFSITPYYFSLMDHENPDCPIRRQGMPSSAENIQLEYELRDFPKEDQMMPVPGLTHRYPDRAMLYTTHHCAMYCRFCTRKRKVSDAGSALQQKQINDALDHIRKNPSLREIILSGGDIFSFADKQLDELLEKARSIEHVEIVRLGTRNLVTLPFRVTDSLLEVLKKYQPLYIHTHFNHPDECSNEALRSCRMLRNAGCVVNNHTVILKGINDRPEVLRLLNQKLLLMGVQPYYAYHCDLTFGSSHFRTLIADDVKMIRELRSGIDWKTEINLPHYMVDTPGGGKIELL
ncbi:MAG: KamA family radical SAM protein [Deltaproteobacteria bacterium]|jgi:lysine 2,3-aminomutase|nr:KamA family radical SAM protein [Deltaproteobacteria bacterium]